MYHIISGGVPAVPILPTFISAAHHCQPSPQIDDEYVGITMVRMFHLHQRLDNDVAPGNAVVGFTCRPCLVLPIPTSTPTTPPLGEEGKCLDADEKKTCSHNKTIDPLLTALGVITIRSHHALSPNFQYQPRNLISWPELSYRFQSHYVMLCESLPNPMTTLPLHQMTTSMTHFTLPTQQKSHQCSPRSTRCPPAD